MSTFEVLPLTTNSGQTFWFATEIINQGELVVPFGPGCINKTDAETLLNAFLEDQINLLFYGG